MDYLVCHWQRQCHYDSGGHSTIRTVQPRPKEVEPPSPGHLLRPPCYHILFYVCRRYVLEARLDTGTNFGETAYSALWDFLLATLPWFIVWKLQMNKREKFGVALAMSLGVL
jgi:hypothetical protein